MDRATFRETEEGADDDLIHIAAAATRDLATPRPAIYWADLIASVLAGYGAVVLAVITGSIRLKLAAIAVAIAALYRALSFIHELTHLKPSAVPGFRFAWNLLVGVPLMIPSFMYEGVHTLHHARTRYGTAADPEYLPLARMPVWSVVLFLLVSLLAPIALLIRFAILAPLSLFLPRLRKAVVERFSALSIAPSFRRKPPDSPGWRIWEAAAGLWAIFLIAGTATGVVAPKASLTFLAVGSGVAFLNQLRTLVAHLWESDGGAVSITGQYLDSVNVPPPALLPVLWAPVGLRYHALHHLLPGIPYHALGDAHRRLVAILPPHSPYHRGNHRSLGVLLRRLLRSGLAKAGAAR